MAKVIIIDLTAEDDEEETQLDRDLQGVSKAQWNFAHMNRSTILRTILSEPFAGAVIVLSRAEALKEARSEYSQGKCSDRLVFWTDGSQRGDRAGTAVVYRKQYCMPIWTEKAWEVHGNTRSNDAELFGVAEAMKIALKTCKDTRTSSTRSLESKFLSVTVYSDSIVTIDAISKFHQLSPSRQLRVKRQPEIAKIRERALELQGMGIKVLIKWVPSHSGVDGNERADRQARRASGVRSRKPGIIIEDIIPQKEQSYIQNDAVPVCERSTRKQNRTIVVGRRMNRFRTLFERLQNMTSQAIDSITGAFNEDSNCKRIG